MDKFNYGQYDPSNTDAVFSDSSYIDPMSETITRRMLSYPLYELKKYLRETCNITSSDDVVQLKLDFTANKLKYSLDGTTWNEITFYGEQGDPGQGVAEGGTEGQILVKASAEDYDTGWESVGSTVDPTSTLPVSGVAVSSAIASGVANKVDKSGTQTFNIDGTTFQLTDSDDNTVEFTVEVV